jgi:translocation and assembly module TamA
VDDFATAAVPIGGNGMALGTLELRVKTDWLLKDSMVVPFADVGRVTAGWSDVFTGLPEFTAGLGLRYLTPFGPARFDVGVLINPEVFSAPLPGQAGPASVASASCGARDHCIALSRIAWHLTLGEAF